MKLLLFLLALVVLLWLLRGSWRRTRPPPKSPGQALMLRCAQCGLHLPRDEALPGRGGVFCGAAHREAFEKAHPDS
jgi:uncharacterized protein